MAAPGTAQWSSKFAFIMAAVGSSVGLGNLWRFSAELGSNGGAAFLVVYIACIFFVGIPVLMSEFMIGRAGQAASAVGSQKRSGHAKRCFKSVERRRLVWHGGVIFDCQFLLRCSRLGAQLPRTLSRQFIHRP